MLSYDKLADNARRFKALMGMPIVEFDLLFAKVEGAHPKAERVRLSKTPRKRAIEHMRSSGHNESMITSAHVLYVAG